MSEPFDSDSSLGIFGRETKQGGVTATRNISGKLSGSRNGRSTREDRWGRSIDANACHWCDQTFSPGQMRYPIMTDSSIGWSVVSVCMSCFKEASQDETGEGKSHRSGRPLAPRREIKCAGCGEPVFASPDHKWRLQICSFRCYQREYRKRRRTTGSAIEWKCVGDPPRNHKCASCQKYFRGKRKDAKFCSDRCRQWQYRRRGQVLS